MLFCSPVSPMAKGEMKSGGRREMLLICWRTSSPVGVVLHSWQEHREKRELTFSTLPWLQGH